jgi:hypothetical protein
MRRGSYACSTIGCATIAVACLPALAPEPVRAAATSVLVPAYFYPDGPGLDDWEKLAASARSITIEAILNPNTGPGKFPNPAYVAVVDRLRRDGGGVLGYVHTSYTKRPIAAVEQDIRDYLKFYNVSGFFIDEMANTLPAIGYYESIYRFIKQLNPEFKVVGNPGTPYTLEPYLHAADTLVIFEGSAAAYASYKPLVPAPWVANYPPSRFANIIYGVRNEQAIREVLTRARQTNAGAVYITSDALPNPYRRLPEYWGHEILAIHEQLARNDSPEAEPVGAPAGFSIGSIAAPTAPAAAPISGAGPPCWIVVMPERRRCAPPRLFKPARSIWWRAKAPGCAGLAGRSRIPGRPDPAG